MIGELDSPPPSGRIGQAAVVVAVVAAVLTWIAVVVAPWTAREAVAGLDYGNVYSFAVIALVLVLLLDTLALSLGLIGVRQPNAKASSGAAIGISAVGFVGVFIYVIGTFVIMPSVA